MHTAMVGWLNKTPMNQIRIGTFWSGVFSYAESNS